MKGRIRGWIADFVGVLCIFFLFYVAWIMTPG